MTLLTVKQSDKEEVFNDTIRVHESKRLSRSGQKISSGRVCLIRKRAGLKSKSVRAIVRGLRNSDNIDSIVIDEYLRERLGVKEGEKYDFVLKEVGWIGQLMWSWSATDPAYRIAAQQAIISLILGFIGLFLGVVSLWMSV